MTDEDRRGVMFCPIDYLTDDGFDMQFGTNVVGLSYPVPFVLLALHGDLQVTSCSRSSSSPPSKPVLRALPTNTLAS